MTWDKEVDWLVVGSGAAGMTSALRAVDLGARVLVVEKSSRFGGSTAMSGGAIWVQVARDGAITTGQLRKR